MVEEKIKYSRHAKRRMKLYNLSEQDVFSIIEHRNPKLLFPEGKHEIIGETILTKQGYPIKVIFSSERGKIIVITAYPLKKGLR